MMASSKQIIDDNYRPSAQAFIDENSSLLTSNQTLTRLRHSMIDIEEFRRIIKLHKNLNEYIHPEEDNKDSTTLLMYAIKYRQKDFIKVLLEEEAIDINKSNPSGTIFPLLMACEEGLLDVVLLLLDYKAKPNIETSDGRTPLIAACQNARVAVILRLLQEKSVDVNYQTSRADTALLSATDRGNLPIVKLLVEYGASVNQRNRLGFSALHRACLSRQTEIVRFLLNHGARVSFNKGLSPITISKRQDDSVSLELLLRAAKRQTWYRLDYWIPYIYREHRAYLVYGLILFIVILLTRIYQIEIRNKKLSEQK
jgi:ankyrin repeat protein